MNRDRWFEMAEGFSLVASRQASGESLCEHCRGLLSVSGVAISLMTESDTTSLCVSTPDVALLEELQFNTGEGPSRDAFTSGEPVLEHSLAFGPTSRWLSLAGLARDIGLEGVFAFPLQIGAARIGALTLYQRDGSAWSTDQLADALIAADVLAHLILTLQAKVPDGLLAGVLGDIWSYRVEVHQAAGMLSVQAKMGVAEALVRLRSLAFDSGRPIMELALAVIDRRLRLENSGGVDFEWGED